MIVVSDTSPITSLIQIDRLAMLHELYGVVVIPSAVHAELLKAHPVLPPFLEVRTPRGHAAIQRLLRRLDVGEAEAIVLAQELHADLIIMDEAAGRSAAINAGLHVMGLLAVLGMARRKGLIGSVAAILDELTTKAGFYVNDELRQRVISEFDR